MIESANKLLRTVLVLLLAVAVFDPADQITHLKVPLFVLAWVTVLPDVFLLKATPRIPYPLLIYVAALSLMIPLVSITFYFIGGGGLEPYDGFRYWKSYLFLTICLLLAIKRIDLVRPLSFMLTGLSIMVLGVHALTYDNPLLAGWIYQLGDEFGFLAIANRSYAEINYSAVYFHTSPLLVIALAYFTYRSITSRGRSRYLNLAILLINVLGMFMSGTRNNMIFSVTTPLLVTLWYSRDRLKLAIITLMVLAAVVGYNFDVFRAVLDPEEVSNSIRLTHLQDYMTLFSDPGILLFGQGLGASFYSTAWGYRTSVTELTYLEIIRNYGLILGLTVLGFLLYPLGRLRVKSYQEAHYLFVAYFCYLVVCVSNPLLVSSSGMLVLAFVLCKAFPTVGRSEVRLAKKNLADGFQQQTA